MEAASNILILLVIIFRGSAGGNKSQKSGGQEVFVGCGGLRTTVSSIEAQWLGGEVVSGGGCRCLRISIIGGQGKTQS